MFIITKATATARPVSLEQIGAMVIAQQRLGFIIDLCWRRPHCVESTNCCQHCSIFSKSTQNCTLHNTSSMDQRQRQRRRRRGREKHCNQHHQHDCSHTKFSEPFIVIGAIVALALFVNCPAFVEAASSKPAIRSIASSTKETDPNRLHANWLEYQRQTLRPRATQSVTPTTVSQTPAVNSNYLSPELGNIFTQLGAFIHARQHNATEMAEHIFFKYYDT